VVVKRIARDAVAGAHVDVKAASDESYNDNDDGINSRCDDKTLAQFDMPNLKVSK
jgi:hypothetical protein